ncbi:sodium:proton antiporter [Paraburkholderia sp. UCT31]|uniref:cation:proton antiporter n=1 Tax=Paraburkholderia sp. UCT31 TaxID=2615209 RepID=UPI00165553BE|nr:cation:proton antiporter [Paraburkholderia sp. UCT31]MBC8741360.1 sodium:proton antiporter [Paraburkholderia sp. UCT31]
MKDEPVWFLLIGALLTFMAVARGPIRRLPLTGAMIYRLVGVAVGPAVSGLVGVDLLRNTALVATLAEVGLVVSLFSIGMHLRVRLRNPLWLLPLRLGGPAMLFTVALMFGFTALVTGRADGAALLLHAYAFVAVFVAGVAVRHEELRATGDKNPSEVLDEVQHGEQVDVAQDPEMAHAVLAESMMGFMREMERLAELSLMLIIGCVVSAHWHEMFDLRAVLPAVFLFFVARPLSVVVAMMGARIDNSQRHLMAWMGIRGVGAFYYLMFGLEYVRGAMTPLLPAVLDAIVLSVLLHGSTANYLLRRYFDRRR